MNKLESTIRSLQANEKLHTALTWFFNSGLFYLGWILAIKYAREGLYLRGPAICTAIIALHLLFVRQPLFEFCLVVTVCFFGLLVDSSLAFAGVISYHGGYACCSWLAPPWVTTLWGLFATSLNHSFSWLDGRPLLSVPLGACGGTLTYMAAIKAGAADLLLGTTESVIILACLWGIIFPLSFTYNRFLKRVWGYR